MANTAVLITGANRGIGRLMAATYLQRPNITLIAGVRDPASATAKSLKDLSHGTGSKSIVVKIDSSSETDAKAAIGLLKTQHGISTIDTVIANAGIGDHWATAADTDVNELRRHLEVNFIGPLTLFQAALPALKPSAHPKFIVISSVLGSIGAISQAPLPTTAYGSSKAAMNFATGKIHQENPDVIAFAVHPGWIKTELGNAAANTVGMAEAPDDMEVTIKALVSLFDGATRDGTSGKFWKYDGSSIPW